MIKITDKRFFYNFQVASGQTDTDLNTENTACVKDGFANIKMAPFSHGNLNEDVESDYMSSAWNSDDKDWVLCPVCGKSIQGRQIIINEHLGMGFIIYCIVMLMFHRYLVGHCYRMRTERKVVFKCTSLCQYSICVDLSFDTHS